MVREKYQHPGNRRSERRKNRAVQIFSKNKEQIKMKVFIVAKEENLRKMNTIRQILVKSQNVEKRRI